MKEILYGATALGSIGMVMAAFKETGSGIYDPRMHAADFGTGAGLASIDDKLMRIPAGEYGSGPTSATKQLVRAAAGEFGSGITKEASTHVAPLAADLEIAGAADLPDMTADTATALTSDIPQVG